MVTHHLGGKLSGTLPSSSSSSSSTPTKKKAKELHYVRMALNCSEKTNLLLQIPRYLVHRLFYAHIAFDYLVHLGSDFADLLFAIACVVPGMKPAMEGSRAEHASGCARAERLGV
mmetsp:Transcript_45693/g.131774  ORF Transcript_45693/g.131774 Transcript_45693/m.131774 type:complete len:115 (-) Transcript_45693:670-1014(-)